MAPAPITLKAQAPGACAAAGRWYGACRPRTLHPVQSSSRHSSSSSTSSTSTVVTESTSGSQQPEEAAAAAAAAASPPQQQVPSPPPLELTVSLSTGMEYIGEEEWDACATSGREVNPFLLHAFLELAESSGCAVRDKGWLPQHVLVRNGVSGELLGCCPMYLKGHSYGEYVFDHSWANAYERMMGESYYPKLLVGVPFTPVTGPRLLVKQGPHEAAVRRALADSLKQVADQLGVSSLSINFTSKEEYEYLGSTHGYLQRTGIQYHWQNQNTLAAAEAAASLASGSISSSDSEDGSSKDAAAAAAAGEAVQPPAYRSFDEGEGSFLMSLRQSKRKSIRQERKKSRQEGLRFLKLVGSQIQARHWEAFYSFYRNTTDRKGGFSYLTPEFFARLSERLGDRVLLVLAETDDPGVAPGEGEPVAGALNLIGSHALFGRNWGCRFGDRVPNLHMELCYFQALEFAIERGLERVEAGAQGEHKLSRGYLPALTYSLHYLPDQRFSGVVERFLYQEREQTEYTMEMLKQELSPFKQV